MTGEVLEVPARIDAADARRLLSRAAALPSLRSKYARYLSATVPDWTSLPPLSKAELNSALDDLLAQQTPARGGMYFYASGGTMSAPRLSLMPGEMFVADILEHWRPLVPRDVLVNLFTPGRMWSAHYFYNQVAVDSGAAVIAFGGLADGEIGQWLDFFESHGATALAATPSTLKRVLAYCARNGRPLGGICKIIWVGERFDEGTGRLLAEVLPDAEVWGQYGSTETWVIGCNGPRCSPDVVHPLPYQHVELLDGAITVTNTHRACINPLLRYQVGDRGEITRCTCGSTRPALRVLGRSDAYFKFLNQLISPEELVGLACEIDGVLDAQVALIDPGTDRERLEIRVRASGTGEPDLPRRVLDRVLAGHLELGYVVGDAPRSVTASVVDRLAENARTAKTPLLVVEPRPEG